MSGCIYKITCLATKKIYIGQASDHKTKNEIPYNYGMSGRWNDHVSSSKTSSKPLHIDIAKYGKDQFVLEELKKAEKCDLDALEAKWIEHFNSVVPNGYNVASHSRNRHHETTNFHTFYEDKVSRADIRPIKNDGEYKLVYTLLHLNDGKTDRIVFGQKDGSTFENAMNEAIEFVTNLNCPYEIDNHNSPILEERYKKKVEQFTDKTITKVRITSASQLIGVYVHCTDGTTRICFEGKTINKNEVYEIAKQFVKLLKVSDLIVEDTYQCRQQAATS
jgi:hypothetical protein